MATKATRARSESAQDPILAEAPTVEIAGVTYHLQRLGLRHVFRVARVLGRGLALLTGSARADGGQVMQALLISLTTNEDEVMLLLADVLGVTRKELDDAERFPMHAMVDVLAALAEHQDLKAFLASVQALTQRLPGMQTPSA